MQVYTNTAMPVNSATCFDNFTIRAYKDESTRITASAKEGHAEDNEVSGVMIGDVVYNSLAEAIEAADPFDTIALYKDVSNEQINLTKSVKIVSNGFALPAFTYIDKENAAVYAYSTIYIENALYKVLVIDENNHPQYLYPSVSADFVVTRDGEIVEAGNGGAALVSTFGKLQSGDKVIIKNDITVSSVITIKVSNLQIDFTGATITADPSLEELFDITASGTHFYSSAEGAVINAGGETKVFSVSSAGSTTYVGKYVDEKTGEIYPGSNLTVNAVALGYISNNTTNFIIDGGNYNCIGANDGDGFLHIKSSGKTTKTSYFTVSNANFTLNDTENATYLFSVNKKAGKTTYYGKLNMDGCTVYGVNATVTVDDATAEITHAVAGMLGSAAGSSVTVSNTYFYNVAMLSAESGTSGEFILERGNFSTKAFGLQNDGVTAADVTYADGIAASAPKAPVAMSFASSAQTEINVAGNALAISALTDPIAYCTAAETDIYVKYAMGNYTSRMIIAAAGTDLTSNDIIPSDIYNNVIPAFEGLYTVDCSI